MSRPVPSFSSFPDFETKEQEKTKERREHESSKARKEKRKEHREPESSRRRRSRSRSHERNKSRHKSKHDSRREDREAGSSRLELHDERAKAKDDRDIARQHERDGAAYSRDYFVDKRGDVLNITYGGLHSGDVPKYRRFGRGKILGLSSAWNIQKGSSSKEVWISLRHRPKASHRYIDSKQFKALSKGPSQYIAIPAIAVPLEGEFAALEISKKRSNHPRDTYRAIADDTKESGSEGSSSDDSLSSSDEAGIALTAEQETMKDIESRLSNKPDDEKAWLRLWQISTRNLSRTMNRTSQAQTEISLSILQKAMEAHPNNRHSPRLRLLYIEYGSDTWSDNRIHREWEDLLLDIGDTHSPAWKRATVWNAWLEWKLVSSRTVDEALDAGKRVMDIFRGDTWEMFRVRLCWRLAIFMREAGFIERAMALFQAQIELCHFCPPDLIERSFSSKIGLLEEFWDSEMPRIAEEGANGWDTWYQDRSEVQEWETPRPLGVPDIQDPYQQWYCLEKALDGVGTFSSRSFNEDQLDPYSTILFSDIQPFLSDINSDQAKEYMRLAFLSFVGMNIPGVGEIPIVDEYTKDYLPLDNGWMISGRRGWVSNPGKLFPPLSDDHLVTWESQAGVTTASEQPKRSGFGPVKEWTRIRPFLEGSGIPCNGRSWETSDVHDVDLPLVRRVLQHLTKFDTSGLWPEMVTALELVIDAKGCIKASKQRLEQDRTSVLLWKTHAKLERIRSKVNDAGKIYEMAIAVDPTSPDLPSLMADGLEYFWLQGNKKKGEQQLSRYLGVDLPFTGPRLLRARQELSTKSSAFQESSTQWQACIRIRFFLEHSAASIQDALGTFDAILSHISPSHHEALTMWLCLMLFDLSQVKGALIRPNLVGERVTIALKRYPNNTVILGLFLESERGQGLWGRVRNLLDNELQDGVDVASAHKGILRTAWEIWAEGWSYGPWQSERVRAKLEKAMVLLDSKRSLVMWHIYIAFEMRVGELEKAKSVLFRALGYCPHAKELYMTAMGPLRPAFKPKELNDMIASMAERGVRMRRDVTDLLEGWVDPERMVLDEDQPTGDVELESFLHAREQAKPY